MRFYSVSFIHGNSKSRLKNEIPRLFRRGIYKMTFVRSEIEIQSNPDNRDIVTQFCKSTEAFGKIVFRPDEYPCSRKNPACIIAFIIKIIIGILIRVKSQTQQYSRIG